MIPILVLLDRTVSALHCRVGRRSSVASRCYRGRVMRTSRRIPGFPSPSALTSLANRGISRCRPDLLPTTSQPQTAIQNA